MATIGGRLDELKLPPRSVPFTLTVGSFLGGGGVQTAWLVLIAGLVPVWYVQRTNVVDPMDAWTFWRESRTVDGEVVELIFDETDSMADEADGYGYQTYFERVTILGLYYHYHGPDGTRFQGTAYGLKKPDERLCNVGVTIPVEYVVEEPRLSRAIGFRNTASSFDQIVGWTYWGGILLMALALPVVLFALLGGSKKLRLLSRGIWSQARVAWSEPSMLLEGFGLRHATFRFEHDRESIEFKAITPDSDESPIEEWNPILYESGRPANAFLLRDFPGHLEVDQSGNLTEGDSNPYHYLWLPAACLIGYSLFLMESLGISRLAI